MSNYSLEELSLVRCWASELSTLRILNIPQKTRCNMRDLGILVKKGRSIHITTKGNDILTFLVEKNFQIV